MEEKEILMNEQDETPENLKEITKMIKKNKELTKEEIKQLEKEAQESVNFLKKIEEIELPSDTYIVFTDGQEQLLYENGEFYIISTTDSRKIRKKKTKKEATDLYLEYFMKYLLNPILDKRVNNKEKENFIEKPEKQVEDKKVEKIEKIETNKEVKSQEKVKEVKIEKDDLMM